MKIQHIAFFALLLFFIWKRNPRWTASAGLILLIISIPLFAKHIFFTAEAFTWYAAGLFLVAVFQNMSSSKVVKLKKNTK
jgi:hypothetical protein